MVPSETSYVVTPPHQARPTRDLSLNLLSPVLKVDVACDYADVNAWLERYEVVPAVPQEKCPRGALTALGDGIIVVLLRKFPPTDTSQSLPLGIATRTRAVGLARFISG